MKVQPLYLIVIGVLLILTGILIKRSGGQNADKNEVQQPVQEVQALQEVQEVQEVVMDPVPEKNENAASIDQVAFELFVSNKFSDQYFTVERITPDRQLAFANLRVDYNIRGKQGSIYLNTTWIYQYTDHTIEVASQEELAGYKSVVENGENLVFKIFGIGGKPDDPKLLYMIPAREITSRQKRMFEVVDFKKENLQANFFFDLNEQTLK